MTQFKQFNEITINCWINLDSLGDYTIAESPNVFEILFPDDGHGFLFRVWDDEESEFTLRSGQTPDLNKWYMLTLVYDQSELKGASDAGTPDTVSSDGNPLFDGNLGIRKGGFEGQGADFRVYDYALTNDQIQLLYDVVDTPGGLVSSKKTL